MSTNSLLNCCKNGPCEKHRVESPMGTEVMNPIGVGLEIGGFLMENGGLDTNYVWRREYGKGMGAFLFDVKMIEDINGEMRHVYELKSRIGSMGMDSVMVDEVDGCCAAVWYESSIGSNVTSTLAAAAIGATELFIDDLGAIGGVGPQVSLIIKTATKTFEVIVSAIDPADPTKVTLSAPLVAAIEAGACVERGIYSPNNDCDTVYSNNVSTSTTNKSKYHSYFRKIIITLEYNDACKLNRLMLTDLLCDDHTTKETAAYRLLLDNYEEQFRNAAREFMYSIYFDTNNCDNAATGPRTMGLFHAINEAHENPDVGDIIYDFSQCCDATSCNPVEAQINALIAVVRSRAELNIYDESRVVIGVNTKFEEALMDMRPFMETMFGAILQKNYTTPGERDVISTRQRLFSIEDRGIEIVFIYDPILNHFDYSMGMMMPENAMGIFQLPVEDVMVSDRGLSLIGGAKMLTGGGSLKMTHVSEPQTMAQQINKCSKHAFYMHYAVIWKYIDKCAYAVITNFGCPKADLCVACGDNAESPFCPNY